jgi:hypothetical protein
MSGNSNTACPTEFAVRGFLLRDKMGVEAMVPPKGTTAERPVSLIEGQFRYNSTLKTMEYYNGTSWIPTGEVTPTDVTGNLTAVSWGQYFVNTNGGAVTLTLPASPAVGDKIRVYDVAKTFDTNNLTVGRNGKLIQGDAADLTVSTEGAAFELVFSGNTFGWRIFTV